MSGIIAATATPFAAVAASKYLPDPAATVDTTMRERAEFAERKLAASTLGTPAWVWVTGVTIGLGIGYALVTESRRPRRSFK